jgi:hypothetical protein
MMKEFERKTSIASKIKKDMTTKLASPQYSSTHVYYPFWPKHLEEINLQMAAYVSLLGCK